MLLSVYSLFFADFIRFVEDQIVVEKCSVGVPNAKVHR